MRISELHVHDFSDSGRSTYSQNFLRLAPKPSHSANALWWSPVVPNTSSIPIGAAVQGLAWESHGFRGSPGGSKVSWFSWGSWIPWVPRWTFLNPKQISWHRISDHFANNCVTDNLDELRWVDALQSKHLTHICHPTTIAQEIASGPGDKRDVIGPRMPRVLLGQGCQMGTSVGQACQVQKITRKTSAPCNTNHPHPFLIWFFFEIFEWVWDANASAESCMAVCSS